MLRESKAKFKGDDFKSAQFCVYICMYQYMYAHTIYVHITCRQMHFQIYSIFFLLFVYTLNYSIFF